ncbi:anti-anti-sigma factor [Streptomyces sp. 1114.5]|uniref:STAS domain-containing protein n=1 Tax=Streptomyces sp. 1114.5 TaxID=1938830 RepID=UPI000EB49F97|nr:STAS domain-containing protein [Streptomyces sp. 1114.5]RKT09453.1 anti-anti-sigma factor [Streptomyces sp. 1114.5]
MSRPVEDRPGGDEHEPAGPEPTGLSVAVDHEGAVRIVTVAGELDHDTADGLREALARPAVDGLERILIDLRDLRFCDSTGLNLLLRARLAAETAGLRLELAGLRPAVARLFAITGADSVLRIHPDLETALTAPGPAARPRDDSSRPRDDGPA